ncbi:MAG: response regulator [Nitrospirae bacterium]|nr:response regulator [Nitrospirota bacterium]
MMKILVVDDNEMSRDLLKRVLAISGYEAITAADGVGGLEAAKQFRPDLIISDIMMPGMDGYQFCRSIRMDADLRETPFLFYSAAFTSPDDVDFAYNLGATRFIQKPQNPRKIIEAIEEILREAHPSEHENESRPLESLKEPFFLKQHSERVIMKLEEKVAELEQTHAFLETVLNSMAEGLVVINKDYSIADVNAAACTLFNKLKEEIIGAKCYNLIHGLSRPCGSATAICPFPKVFNDGAPAETVYEHTIVCPDHILEIIASPCRDATGNIGSLVSLIRDGTERAKLQEEIAQRIKDLEDFHDAAVEREMRRIDLEKEVKRLREEMDKGG